MLVLQAVLVEVEFEGALDAVFGPALHTALHAALKGAVGG